MKTGMGRTGFCVLLVLGSGGVEASAQAVLDPEFTSTIEESRAGAEALLERVPGFAVAVGVGDRIVWSEGFGHADLETRREVDERTIFRVFSLSKAITATTLMRLAQADRIDLDAPISGIVSDLPTEVGRATPRQLAGHLGGIRHYNDGEAWNQRHCETPADAVRIFAADGAVHPPGSEFLYTSWGFALLSRAIEAAAGAPFAQVVTEETLEPVGMESTSLGVGIDPQRTTRFYDRRGFLRKRNRPAEEVDISCKWGGGAFLSTAADVAALGVALLNDTLLGAEARATLFAEMKTDSGEGTGYAMGIGSRVSDTGRTSHTHTGSGAGGRSALLIYPEAGLVVVAVANNREEGIVDFASSVARSFLSRLGG